MKNTAPQYDNPDYYFRLFHEGRPEEIRLAEYNKRAGDETGCLLGEILGRTPRDDLKKLADEDFLDNLFGVIGRLGEPFPEGMGETVKPKPVQTEVDPMADIW